MKPKTTLVFLLLAGLTTVTLASTASAAPASTMSTATVVEAAPALSPAKKDRPYAFLFTKKGKPGARWYPCRPITWAVVEKGLVPEEIPRITQAFATISSVTGLTFRYKGVSKKHGKSPRYHTPTIPGADIAIIFEDFSQTYPKQVSSSAYGGAQYASYTSRIARYQYGYVRVDTPDLPSIPEPLRQVLFMHELGHVLGLDHAPGPNVMNPTLEPDVMQFSAGDLAGLKLVGRQAGDCKSGSPFRG